jgi:Fur family transcriptional regulator, peroxide stress response regulator
VKVDKGEVGRRVEGFKDATKKVGVKLTHQRLEIFREVAASAEHPDAESVFRAVRKRMPTVSLDTVYRTLWRLNHLGVIRSLGPRHESVRFDANLDHHHHYTCIGCGLVKDFKSADLDQLRVRDSIRGFGSVVAVHVEIRGFCEKCRKMKGALSAPGELKKPQGRGRKKK